MGYITQTHYYRYFKNHLFSETGCFFIYVILFALLFPFLFAVSTGEFCYEIKYDFKQPQNTPRGQYSLQSQDAQNIETYSSIMMNWVYSKILQMISSILNINEDFSNYRVFINGQLKFYQKNALSSSSQTRKIQYKTDYYFEDQLHQLQKHVLNNLNVKYDKYLFKKAVDNRVIIGGQLLILVLQDIGQSLLQ